MTADPVTTMIARLRRAADALAALQLPPAAATTTTPSHRETPATAAALRAGWRTAAAKQARGRKRRLHWTQRPENKAKLARMVRASVKARRAARAARARTVQS